MGAGDPTTDGEPTGLWQALLSAIADTIHEASGRLMGRLSLALSLGDTTVTIGETHRWPDAGRFVVGGVTGRYTGRTPTTLTGMTADDGGGWVTEARAGEPIMLLSGQSAMDDLRDTFFLDTAVEGDLDTIGRNYGIDRPFGMTDTTYRALLKALTYLPAGGVYSIETIMTVLRGAGNFNVYELLPDPERHRVFVEISTLAGDDPRGKSFMVGLEAQTRTSALTVDTSYAAAVVSGIWADTDPYRAGTNYAEGVVTATLSTGGATISAFTSFWAVADEGKSVTLSNGELWQVISYLDPFTVQLGHAGREDATLVGGSDEIVVDDPYFREWMVGHDAYVGGTLNAGVYPILAWVDPYTVKVDVSAHPSLGWLTETDATITIRPNFPGGNVNARVLTALAAGVTVTTTVAMPTAVLVDYATIPSAQIVRDRHTDGNDQSPLYLYDDTEYIESILDVITVAGVEPVVEVI